MRVSRTFAERGKFGSNVEALLLPGAILATLRLRVPVNWITPAATASIKDIYVLMIDCLMLHVGRRDFNCFLSNSRTIPKLTGVELIPYISNLKKKNKFRRFDHLLISLDEYEKTKNGAHIGVWTATFQEVFSRLSRRTKFIVRSVDNAIQSVPETRANPLSSKEYGRAFIRKCSGITHRTCLPAHTSVDLQTLWIPFYARFEMQQSRGRICYLNRETFHRIRLNIKKLIKKGIFLRGFIFARD